MYIWACAIICLVPAVHIQTFLEPSQPTIDYSLDSGLFSSFFLTMTPIMTPDPPVTLSGKNYFLMPTVYIYATPLLPSHVSYPNQLCQTSRITPYSDFKPPSGAGWASLFALTRHPASARSHWPLVTGQWGHNPTQPPY